MSRHLCVCKKVMWTSSAIPHCTHGWSIRQHVESIRGLGVTRYMCILHCCVTDFPRPQPVMLPWMDLSTLAHRAVSWFALLVFQTIPELGEGSDYLCDHSLSTWPPLPPPNNVTVPCFMFFHWVLALSRKVPEGDTQPWVLRLATASKSYATLPLNTNPTFVQLERLLLQ